MNQDDIEFYKALLAELAAIEKHAKEKLHEKFSVDLVKRALYDDDAFEQIAPLNSEYNVEKYCLMLLHSIADVRTQVNKQQNIPGKIAILEAARAGFDVGLNYLAANDKRIGKIVADIHKKRSRLNARKQQNNLEPLKQKMNAWIDVCIEKQIHTAKGPHQLQRGYLVDKVFSEYKNHPDSQKLTWGKKYIRTCLEAHPSCPPQQTGRKRQNLIN